MTTAVLVGTKKGAWIYTSEDRKTWQISEPLMPGWTISHMAADTRRNPVRLYAGASHWAWGPSVAYSDDGGKTWENRSPGLAFEADSGRTVGSVWNIVPGHSSRPGEVYAGTQPAGLFKSENWGESWKPVSSINDHPFHTGWNPTGGGDSCLHSIAIDPRDANHMFVSISTGGTYETTDSGERWEICTHRIVATTEMAKQMEKAFAERFPELFAQFEEQFKLPPNVDPAAADEFHKLRIDPKNPDRLWGQAHIGVYRLDHPQDKAGWQDMTEGLPSFHGFGLGVTHHEPDAVFVVPLAFEEDNFRVVRGQFAVWRTKDQGKTWEALTNGLPGPNDYQSVYREGIDTDGQSPEGVYVGTSNGQVYGSADLGESWQRLPGTLPPILSVTCASW